MAVVPVVVEPVVAPVPPAVVPVQVANVQVVVRVAVVYGAKFISVSLEGFVAISRLSAGVPRSSAS